MKYYVRIEGINPSPDCVLQSFLQTIEGCRNWAESNLEHLPHDARHAGAVAVIYRSDLIEVERVVRDMPVLDLRDEIGKIIEDINNSLTKVGRDPLSQKEIAERLMETLNRVGEK